MCIAIYKKPDVEISLDTLRICADNNPDGCGLAYINSEEKLIVDKAMKFDDWVPKYEAALDDNPDSPFMLHFRVETHGGVNMFNCHPFWVHDNLVMMHNGTILNSTPRPQDKDKRSDTQIFNDTILKGLAKDFYKETGAMQDLIEQYIGRSKVVVMDNEGFVNIYNESLGNWHEGIWYSNYSYHPNTKSTALYPGVAKNDYYSTSSSLEECTWCIKKHDLKELFLVKYTDKSYWDDLLCVSCLKDLVDLGDPSFKVLRNATRYEKEAVLQQYEYWNV